MKNKPKLVQFKLDVVYNWIFFLTIENAFYFCQCKKVADIDFNSGFKLMERRTYNDGSK